MPDDNKVVPIRRDEEPAEQSFTVRIGGQVVRIDYAVTEVAERPPAEVVFIKEKD